MGEQILATRVVKTVEIAGHAVRVHACPFNLSAPLFEAGDDRSASRGAMERIVRAVAEVPDGADIGDFATLAEFDRIAAIAIADENPPSF